MSRYQYQNAFHAPFLIYAKPKFKKSMIRLDNKKVKSETLTLEEEIEGMLLEYEYMDRPIKTGRQNFIELYQKF